MKRSILIAVNLIAWSPAGTSAVAPGLNEMRATIHSLACAAGVPPDLALATIEHESGFRNEMRGRNGEIGMSQILPATALALGFDLNKLANDFRYNARAGVSVLLNVLTQSRGDSHAALFTYKAGPNWRKTTPQVQRGIREYVAAIEKLRGKYFGDACQ